jgi:hypothetical protein
MSATGKPSKRIEPQANALTALLAKLIREREMLLMIAGFVTQMTF